MKYLIILTCMVLGSCDIDQIVLESDIALQKKIIEKELESCEGHENEYLLSRSFCIYGSDDYARCVAEAQIKRCGQQKKEPKCEKCKPCKCTDFEAEQLAFYKRCFSHWFEFEENCSAWEVNVELLCEPGPNLEFCTGDTKEYYNRIIRDRKRLEGRGK